MVKELYQTYGKAFVKALESTVSNGQFLCHYKDKVQSMPKEFEKYGDNFLIKHLNSIFEKWLKNNFPKKISHPVEIKGKWTIDEFNSLQYLCDKNGFIVKRINIYVGDQPNSGGDNHPIYESGITIEPIVYWIENNPYRMYHSDLLLKYYECVNEFVIEDILYKLDHQTHFDVCPKLGEALVKYFKMDKQYARLNNGTLIVEQISLL